MRRAPSQILIRAALALTLAVAGIASAAADDFQYFRIGTGSTGGTYFPIGGIIASAVSKPPGSRDCEQGGSCGVAGLIAVAQATLGSVENVQLIASGQLESGLCQADIAFWAYNGRGIFDGKGALKNLRAIANLYPEQIHLVVRADSGIKSIGDLKGKRVSLDREGSGTLVDAKLILEAYGVKLSDLTVVNIEPGPAADRIKDGTLDAFFLVSGAPASAITELAAATPIALVPITGPPADKLRMTYPFLAANTIDADAYRGVGATATLSVGAQWLVAEDVPDDIVYGLTKALWQPSTLKLLEAGHPQGRHIRLDTAITGLGIPIHPGALRYYKEQMVLP
jgi:uncharacterized protein